MSTVLVVDDDRTVTHLVERSLSDGPISVLTAKTAEEGLSLVRSAHPDVVLLDIMLPGTSGLDVFHKIQEVDRRVPVIFITAGAGSETAIQAMQLGAYDYVAKPLDVAQLRTLVAKALETRRMMSVPVALPISSNEEPSGDIFVGSQR
jgi:DNA-binding NtrC family response regulator